MISMQKINQANENGQFLLTDLIIIIYIAIRNTDTKLGNYIADISAELRRIGSIFM